MIMIWGQQLSACLFNNFANPRGHDIRHVRINIPETDSVLPSEFRLNWRVYCHSYYLLRITKRKICQSLDNVQTWIDMVTPFGMEDLVQISEFIE